MKLEEQQLLNLLHTLERTQDEEWDCDQCLSAVAAYAENELAGKTPTEALAHVEQHLSICPDCREEYRALLRALQGITPGDTI